MKTIKEWFESVENPILRKVLLMGINKQSLLCDSLLQAIYQDFVSSKNVVDDSAWFWNVVCYELKTSNESPTFNNKYPVMQVEWLNENECIWCQTEEEINSIKKLLNSAKLKFNGCDTSISSYIVPKRNPNDIGKFKKENYTIYPAKLFIKDMKQDLLEEAKCRYPVGCKFKSALNKKEQVVYCDNYDNYHNHSVFVQISDNEVPQIDYLYYYNRWAEYVEVFGFKVGDVIEANILTKWTKSCNNWNDCNNWEINLRAFNNDYEIKSIDFKNGHIAFKININSYHVWIKAEGLREFIEQQNQNNIKPQKLTLGQLKDLIYKGNCIQWETIISKYIQPNWRKKDDETIEIDNADIYYAKKHCNKAQLKLLQDAGLKFEEECPYKIGDWIMFKNNVYQIKSFRYSTVPCKKGFFLLINDKAETDIDYEYYKSQIRKATEAEIKYAQIEWDKLKTGSVVKLKCELPNMSIIHETKIVIICSFHYINSDCEFVESNEGFTTTLFQKLKSGKSIYYGVHYSRLKNIIAEVISY